MIVPHSINTWNMLTKCMCFFNYRLIVIIYSGIRYMYNEIIAEHPCLIEYGIVIIVVFVEKQPSFS